MKRQRLIVGGIMVVVLLMPAVVRGEDTPSLLIAEVQTRSSQSADEEFVELINVSSEDIDLSQVRLEYRSATGTAWNLKATLHGSLKPGKRFLLASTNYLVDSRDESFASGLSDAGGHLRLAETGTAVVYDLLGWGNALSPEVSAAPVLSAGKSLERITVESVPQDTDDNSQDFILQTTPTPESTYEIEVVEPEPDPENPPEQVEEPSTEPTTTNPDQTPPVEEPVIPLKPLLVTELLPNPKSPQSDDQDEYIELYNPNEEPVDLDGYKLQTGNSFSYSYAFSDQTIPAKSYMVITSGNSNLTLANTSGRARLVSPTGTVVSEVSPYEDAEEGEAWALITDTWQWTTQPTPAAPNVLAIPVVVTPTKKQAVAKPKAAAKSSAKKATAAKAPKSTKEKKVNEPSAVLSTDDEQAPPLHPAILASVSAVALLYAGYEYRHDVLNRLYQLRSYRAARRAARQSA